MNEKKIDCFDLASESVSCIDDCFNMEDSNLDSKTLFLVIGADNGTVQSVMSDVNFHAQKNLPEETTEIKRWSIDKGVKFPVYLSKDTGYYTGMAFPNWNGKIQVGTVVSVHYNTVFSKSSNGHRENDDPHLEYQLGIEAFLARLVEKNIPYAICTDRKMPGKLTWEDPISKYVINN